MSSADLRASIARKLEALDEDDLRVVDHLLGLLPVRRLALQLHGEVARGLRKLGPTSRADVVRAELLGLMRRTGLLLGLQYPSAAALRDELTGRPPPAPRPAHRPIEAL